MEKTIRKLCLTACLILLVPTTSAQDGSTYWLGAERGPHATGTTIAMWTDAGRDDTTTSNFSDKRRVMVQIWYPAAADAQTEFALYARDITLYDDGIQEIFDAAAERLTRSRIDAPLSTAQQRFPVLLYSHGGGAQNFSGTFITEFLASHGYVVLSVGHSDDSRLVRFPDGSAYKPDALPPPLSPEESAGWPQVQVYEWLVDSYREPYARRGADLRFALDRLQALDTTAGSLFENELDMDRVGALGWSLGGSAALQATVDDPRVKAAVNLDGTLFGVPVESAGSSRPLLLVENAAFLAPPAAGATDADRRELLAAVDSATWGMFRRSTNDWYRATLSGTNHQSFSDYILQYETLPDGLLDPTYAHGIINALVLEFFEKYLNGSSDTPLLDGTAAYPELKLNRSAPRD